MTKESLLSGRTGESRASLFLQGKGYRILETNYRNKLGEIDIIAEKCGVICFIEVKTRNSLRFGFPEESVSFSKQRRICRLALSFLKEKKQLDSKVRFDVVSIINSGPKEEIKLIENAFEAG